MRCNLCQSKQTRKQLTIKVRDRFEIASGIIKKNYFRNWYKCKTCKALCNVHKKNNQNKLKKISKNYFKIDFPNINPEDRFKKIINLPKKNSDNFYRVKRIIRHLTKTNKISNFLDFGAGLGVFLHQLLKENFKNKSKWFFFSFETDNSNKKLLNNINGIKNLSNKIFKQSKKFDFISLNKVLEHIDNPLQFLKKIKNILRENGTIYIEVPHISGANRKNDNSLVSLHCNIYSKKSLILLASKLNLKIMNIKIIKEPSNKKTIYTFLKLEKNAR